MERKLGELFSFNGVEYRTEISRSSVTCFGCCFSMPRCHKPPIGFEPCAGYNKEGLNIIFKKVQSL